MVVGFFYGEMAWCAMVYVMLTLLLSAVIVTDDAVSRGMFHSSKDSCLLPPDSGEVSGGSMEIWSQIWSGINEEFANFPDVRELTRLVVRMLTAAILGGLIGIQREWSGKAAGLRTHMMVCLGTTFFIAVPERLGMGMDGLSRIIQGIAAGLGFLGAGVIIKHEGEGRIEGLTTSTSIWFIAAIGLAVGLGREGFAILASIMAFVILCFVRR